MQTHAYNNQELETLERLECAIHNAFLETKEFALYSVLQILLEAYTNTFKVFKEPNTSVFVHAVPQDTLTAPPQVISGVEEASSQQIPDATVRITRLHRNQGKKTHHMVLVIEAKRLGTW